MRLAEAHTRWLQKAGHRPEEYEDAAAGPVAVGGIHRAAIADGATESAFAGAWARALAEAWVAEGDLDAAVRTARAAFAEKVGGRAEGLPWYAAAKAEAGAHATLLGVVLRRGGWSAVAVGDGCLFHLRGEALLRAWPLDDPDLFSNRPALLASRADAPLPEPEHAKGTVEPGDRLLLATDALAAYLLRHGPHRAAGLDPNAFAEFVARARSDGMRNDDVTLLELVL